MKATLVISILLCSLIAKAEYRAYQYIVEAQDPYARATKAKPQYIVSTLNPQMYRSYHGGSAVKIDLLRTWICPGYTAKQQICDHPYDKEEKLNE